MSKIKDFFSNLWYNLINGGFGGMMIILFIVSGLYYMFFATGGNLVLPVTIVGFSLFFLYAIYWVNKNRK